MSSATAGTPSGVYDGPLPGAGQFGLYQATLEKAFTDAKTQIAGQRNSFLTQQGIGSLNADGSFKINANAPGGAYQQMATGNALQRSADDAGIAGEGFAGGGILNQQHEAGQAAYSQNAANWAQGAVSNLNSFNQQDVDNTSQYGQAVYSGLLSDVQSAIAAGTYNPANYSGITLPDGTTFNAPPLGTGSTGTSTGGAGFTPPPVGGSSVGGMGQIGGKTVYGYGVGGAAFFSRAAATAAGRLGKKKGQA